jgi:hypothetical protein
MPHKVVGQPNQVVRVDVGEEVQLGGRRWSMRQVRLQRVREGPLWSRSGRGRGEAVDPDLRELQEMTIWRELCSTGKRLTV